MQVFGNYQMNYGCLVLAGQVKVRRINTRTREHLMLEHKEAISLAWQHGKSVAEEFYEASNGQAWKFHSLCHPALEVLTCQHTCEPDHLTHEWAPKSFCVLCPREVNHSFSLRRDQSCHLCT